MAKSTVSRGVKLFGTDAARAKTRLLSAGPITAMFDNGALRYIQYHGTEVLRGIAYLVRDKNWGTYSPTIENLKVRQGKDNFTVSYTATCRDAQQAIRYDARIEASSAGEVKFTSIAAPDTDFVTNRTGFVVLHPLEGVVGAPVDIVHTDGKREKSRFPKIISPGQPVFEIRSLKHTVMPGVSATVLMEGNKFEMEDHRNWMDASYKTYVCSLLDPWPYTLKKGESFAQSVTVTIAGKPKGRAARSTTRVEVAVGGAKGRMPAIGLGIAMQQAAASLDAVSLLTEASPAHLVCQIDGRLGGAARAAAAFRAIKDKTGKPVTLEIVLPAKASAAEEVAAIARDVNTGGLNPDAIVITQMHDLKSFQPNTPRPWGPTYEEMASAVRSAFPGVPVGGGMLSFFTELNRKPVPKGVFDFITHTVCPIVHAADDISVMETLQSMPSIIASTRHMIGKTPYHLGPSSIPCRDNPYGAAVAPNPDNDRVCLSDVEPRQRGLFAAAWYMGLVAAAARGGIEAVALGSFAGPQGIFMRHEDAGGNKLHPAFHVLAGLGRASSRKRIDCQSSAPSRVEALAHLGEGGPVLWLANLTADTQTVKVSGFKGPAQLRMLDVGSFARASRAPGFLQAGGTTTKKPGNVVLTAYAVACISTA